MSETLHIWPEVKALCAKAGLEPNAIDSIMITPNFVQFAVIAEPLEIVGDGLPLVDIIFHPWTREP